MAKTYNTGDLNTYRMDYYSPHRAIEPLEREIAVVDKALELLREEGLLPHTRYDHEKMLAHRRAVQELFDIPWTAVTGRMQRLLYAINAIAQPRNMLAAGVYCGNTFISNAGAAVGPGACYTASNLIGIEILPEEAQRAERNIRRLDPSGVARIVAGDAVEVVARFKEPINLLYLDADGDERQGKGVYYDILQSGYDRIPTGGLVLAHNSYNAAEKLKHYLEFVRDPGHFRASVNLIIDIEGIEVSIK